MPDRPAHRPQTRAARWPTALAGLAGVAAVVAGCTEMPALLPTNDRVALEDFVGDESRPGEAPPATQTTAQTQPTANDSDPSPGDPPAREALAVDAMIGHVNGEAIYAHAIFEPIDAQLSAFGRNHNGDEFLRRAAPVVAGRLQEVLIDKLILAEADGRLSERDRQGVEGLVQLRREELLRYYGRGSLARARAEHRAAEGIELEEALAQYRESLVVRRYLQQELMPQINVQQRDVERLYTDLYEQGVYNSPDQRVIRLMMTRDADNADTIARRLADGEAFAQVAGDATLNSYNAVGGGQFNSGEALSGEDVFTVPEVNAAILELEAGAHAGPVESEGRHFFVQLESYEPGVVVALRDVQVELEQRLRLEQWDVLFRRFRQGLLEQGGFTDPMQMADKLLDIAIARYDSVGG